MDTIATSGSQQQHGGNLGRAERWLSTLAGVGLLASAFRGRGIAGRLARGSAGVSLIARGASGFCAMKSAVQGQSSLGEGFQQQWNRLSSGFGQTVQRARTHGAPQITSMESMYVAELQELHSAENQLIALLRKVGPLIDNQGLALRVDEYASELHAREDELDTLLDQREHAEHGAHPDHAIRALIRETHKMAAIPANTVRDAAIAASIQRIIHYKIAGYGTIAAYAKALGRTDVAGRFAQMADRDKAIDAEITELAKTILNPEAVIAPQQGATSAPSQYTH